MAARCGAARDLGPGDERGVLADWPLIAVAVERPGAGPGHLVSFRPAESGERMQVVVALGAICRSAASSCSGSYGDHASAQSVWEIIQRRPRPRPARRYLERTGWLLLMWRNNLAPERRDRGRRRGALLRRTGSCGPCGLPSWNPREADNLVVPRACRQKSHGRRAGAPAIRRHRRAAGMKQERGADDRRISSPIVRRLTHAGSRRRPRARAPPSRHGESRQGHPLFAHRRFPSRQWSR